MSTKAIQAQSFTLSGAGNSVGDTTLGLTSFQVNSTNITMAMFGTIGYGTIEPNSRDNEEQISFTGITNNADGTVTLTGVKTILNYTPYTETSGLAHSHAGGTTFILTNTSAFYNKFPVKENTETISAVWTFSESPVVPTTITSSVAAINVTYANSTYVALANNQTIAGVKTFSSFPVGPSSAPTNNYQFCNKKYADDLAIAGSPDASAVTKGISYLSSAPSVATSPTALNSEEVVTTGAANKVPRTGANGKIDSSFFDSIPDLFDVTACGKYYHVPQYVFSSSVVGLAKMVNDVSPFLFILDGQTPTMQQNITMTDVWADVDEVISAIVLGGYLYLLLRDNGTEFRVYRFDENDIAAGGSLMTFSGQNLAYKSDYQRMATDGTSFYFNYKSGNSALGHVISKFSLSSTTLTYVSDVTLSDTTFPEFIKVDSSGNYFMSATTTNTFAKFGNTGTFSSSTVGFTLGTKRGFYDKQGYTYVCVERGSTVVEYYTRLNF